MLTMAYDGSGRRVSKTRFRKACISDEADGVYAADWERELVTHYTGIGTEVRESFHNGTPSETKVVVNMPQGLGRYMPEDASAPVVPSTTLDENGKPTDWSVFNPKFEWYLKNHLGSTMLVYGTQGSSNADVADLGEVKKAYDYRSFGEQIDLIADAGDKVTENFTGKEKDDETELNYFGARYLDPMIGMWISVDPARQFSSPYLYVGNGMNPVNGVDPDGNAAYLYATKVKSGGYYFYAEDDKGRKPVSGSFNKQTMNINQLGVGSYTISPRPYLTNVGLRTRILNWWNNIDINDHAGRPSISNTDDWNTVKNADGSITRGAQIHPGKNGTAGGTSLACLVTDEQSYNQLKEMFDDNYDDGGVFLEILPEGTSLPQVETGDPVDIKYSP
ncbi:hypothetical protein MMG03_002991 [Fibrobacter succinogenes]|nr:hypothetical protein [Fibrobacter succinogenes]